MAKLIQNYITLLNNYLAKFPCGIDYMFLILFKPFIALQMAIFLCVTNQLIFFC